MTNLACLFVHFHIRLVFRYETIAIHIIEDNCTRTLIQVYLQIGHSATSTLNLKVSLNYRDLNRKDRFLG